MLLPTMTNQTEDSDKPILSRATFDKIFAYATPERRERYFDYLNETFLEYDIDTPLRLAAFCAQVSHESVSFKHVEEIASGEAYEGRADLGNTQKGDGKLYKGRGLLQITGRANYEELSDDLGEDFVSSPKLLLEPKWAALSAGWFWNTRNLNMWADKGDFRKITRIINGGYNGWESRITLYLRNKSILRI